MASVMDTEEIDKVATTLQSPFSLGSPAKRRIRQRAGTYGGFTMAETSARNKLQLKEQQMSESEDNETGHDDEKKKKIGKLLTEKRKFSRQNRWGSCSYKDLIIHAIESSINQKMTLNEIYDWIVANIPHFKNDQDTNSSVGWKNSIRHNLSLHSVFVKEQQNGSKSIGAHWKLDMSKQPSKRRRAGTLDPEKLTHAQRRRSTRPSKTKTRDVRDQNSSPYRPPSACSSIGHMAPGTAGGPMEPIAGNSGVEKIEYKHDAIGQLDAEFYKLNTSHALSESVSPEEVISRSDDEVTTPTIKSESVTIQLRIPYSAYRLYKKGNYQVCILPNSFRSQAQYAKSVVLNNPEYWEVFDSENASVDNNSPPVMLDERRSICQGDGDVFKEPLLPENGENNQYSGHIISSPSSNSYTSTEPSPTKSFNYDQGYLKNNCPAYAKNMVDKPYSISSHGKDSGIDERTDSNSISELMGIPMWDDLDMFP